MHSISSSSSVRGQLVWCCTLLVLLSVSAQPSTTSQQARKAAQLLPAPVRLSADWFNDDPTANCTAGDALFLQLDPLAYEAALAARAATIVLSIVLDGAQQLEASIVAAAGLTVLLYQSAGWLTVASQDGVAKYALTTPSTGGPLTVVLALNNSGYRLCMDLSCPAPAQVTGVTADSSGWVAAATASLTDITCGSAAGRGVSGTLQGMWVVPGAVSWDTLASQAASPADAVANVTAAPGSPPVISLASMPQSAVVGAAVSVTVAASASSQEPVNLRLTLWGATPSGCSSSSCGDVTQTFRGAGGPVTGTVSAVYPRAGRYAIRAQASDDAGGWASQDFVLLVRKAGDDAAKAPCCRSTALIIAQQLGRPIDPAAFRPAWINGSAAAVGWDAGYLAGPEDLEAERLFDYTSLAPTGAGPLQLLTCADRHLAGLGSPKVYGVEVADGNVNAASNQGHNKRVGILPQGFNWAPSSAAGTKLPTCVTSWTNWPSKSPYGIKLGSNVWCSYGCVPLNVEELSTVTGTVDRWAEAVIENSYGHVSLLADPLVLPTLDMPRTVAAGLNAFTYSGSLIQQHLQKLGYDLNRDFHTLLVLSPLPQFINPGYTAWSVAGGSPLIYVMRCNPQHYYLLHEIGHRFGMPHATIYKLTNESVTAQAPTTNLLSAGVMEDAYSDRLDIMACCKGDYSLYNRILAGWVPGTERATIGLSDMLASPSSPVTRRFTLWPYDRPESKGQLKGVTMRIEDGKVLVLGHRSLPFWQDVRISHDITGAKPTAPEHMRDNLAGLSVEYAKRYVDSYGSSTWSARGLLDFNMAFARFPAALPPKAGTYPPDPPGAAFTLLREGDAWFDEDHNVLVAVERLVPCEGGSVPVWVYKVPNFFGFRGENPGLEAVRRADYSGYATGLRCLQLRVVTGVSAAPGTLDVKLRLTGLDSSNRLILGGDQCGFPFRPRLRLELPDDADIIATVWRDNLNRTIAVDTNELQLPALQPLTEASAQDTEQCNVACDWRYHVKVLAADGSQTQVDIAVGSVSLSSISLTATYRHYLRSSILTAVEYHAIPVLPTSPLLAGAADGRSLLPAPTSLQLAGAQVFDSSSLPDFSCSRQWSISLNMLLPAAAVAPPSGSDARLVELLSVLSSTGAVQQAAWPRVSLRVSSAGTGLVVQWGRASTTGSSNAREQQVTILPNRDGWASVHLAVVRDDTRLGVWLDSNGSWVLDNVWCIPQQPGVRYCTQPTLDPTTDSTFRALRLGDGSDAGRDISVASARVYNYVLPRASLNAESACVDAGSCGRFLLAGWAPPAAATIPAGSITGTSVQPVASSPIKLRATSYFLLVSPWSACSAVCGGGWASRDVRCMKLAAAGVAEVPVEECPLGEDVPVSNKRCNTVACPKAAFAVLASNHSSCGGSCSLLPSGADGPQLVCINSLGQPLPLGQCCSLCNVADWRSLPWGSSLSQLRHAGASLASEPMGIAVKQLPVPAASGSNTSLHDMVMTAGLGTACNPGSSCGQPLAVRWQLSSWGACSTTCGGGYATRSATCLDAVTGAQVDGAVCTATSGHVPGELLVAPCNLQPCFTFTWQAGKWSTCSGDSAFGFASRAVSCMDQKGSTVAVSSSTCTSRQPPSSAVCITEATTAACRPSFLPDSLFGGQDCYGHGECGATGCSCNGGWHGQFCEVQSAKCAGVMDRFDKCCSSGVLNVGGECCPDGAVLDSAGACCLAGKVDVCGTCDGNSWAIDTLGTCCAGVLDATGVCCTSGAVDECGVCDGTGSSCSLHLRLHVLLPPNASIAAGIPATAATVGTTYTASDALMAWAQATVRSTMQQAGYPVEQAARLQVVQVTAALLPVPGGGDGAVSTSPAPPSRHLLEADAAQQDRANECSSPAGAAVVTSIAGTADRGQLCAKADMHTAGVLPPAAPATGDAASGPASYGGTRGPSRRLQQAAGGALTPAQLDILLAAISLAALPSAGAGSGSASAAGFQPWGTLGLGVLLASQLESSASLAANATDADASGSPVVSAVMLAQRLGVCGNGLCEVGERVLLNVAADVVQPAAAACPQDCPGSIRLCPAPVGLVGDPDIECGGHGRCLRAQGTCDCFAGYTGDACDVCLASFYPHRRSCTPQFISGRNIFDVVVEGQQALVGWSLALVIIGCVAAAACLGRMAWTLWRWLVLGQPGKLPPALSRVMHSWRHCLPPAWLHRGRASGISKKYLLDDGMELSPAAAINDGRATRQPWSESPTLRQRPVTGDGSPAGSDMLQADRPRGTQRASGSLHSKHQLASSTSSNVSRLSSGSGHAGQQHSSASTSDGAAGGSPAAHVARWSLQGGSPLAQTLSGVASALQRALSNVSARLSQQGSASYERLVDTEAGAMEAGVGPEHPVGRSRLGSSPAHQQPGGQFFLPARSPRAQGPPVPMDVSPQHSVEQPHSAAAATGPHHATAPPCPSPASLQPYVPADILLHQQLVRPPGLARIRTRPRQASGTGGPAAGPARAHSNQAGVPAGQQGDEAAQGGAGDDGSSGPTAGSSASTGRLWRTRQQYQEDLMAGSTGAVLSPHLLQQVRDRRVPSEPGLQAWPRGRHTTGVPFVQTPTAQDGTIRDIVESFGQKIELFFSPKTYDSSSGSGASTSSGARGGVDGSSFGGLHTVSHHSHHPHTALEQPATLTLRAAQQQLDSEQQPAEQPGSAANKQPPPA